MKDTSLKGLFCLAFKNVWTVRISVISRFGSRKKVGSFPDKIR